MPVRSLPGTALTANIAIAAIALAALIIGWPRLRAHRHASWLLAGIVIAFAGFHVVAMDAALLPTSERYGVFMLVPLVIAIAAAIDALTERNSMAGRAAVFVVATVMAAMLVGGYFVPLWARGGDAMTTYRTGATEPKVAAFAFIDSDSRGAESVRVIADGWWLYWTLRYLAGAEGRIHVDVVPGSNMPGGTHPAGAVVPPFPAPQRTYLVAFEGGAVPPGGAPSTPRFTARDPAGRPILHVYAVDPTRERAAVLDATSPARYPPEPQRDRADRERDRDRNQVDREAARIGAAARDERAGDARDTEQRHVHRQLLEAANAGEPQ